MWQFWPYKNCSELALLILTKKYYYKVYVIEKIIKIYIFRRGKTC